MSIFRRSAILVIKLSEIGFGLWKSSWQIDMTKTSKFHGCSQRANGLVNAGGVMSKKNNKKISKTKAAEDVNAVDGHKPPEKRKKMKREAYERELERLQTELVELQEWIKYKGLKVVVIFEGRDTAGKGGTIKRITERLNPRVVRVVALGVSFE